jgi:TctA family transporter
MIIGARAVGLAVLSGNYPIHPTFCTDGLYGLSLGLDNYVDEMNRLRQYRQPRRIPPDFLVKWREFPTLPAFMSALVFFWCGDLSY